jgi:dTDP-4-amino-4,6-dideoxygalactose transaminase
MSGTRLAVLGGAPRFPVTVPVTRPSLPTDDALVDQIRRILESGMLTAGPLVRAFEAAVAETLGVPHVVAVNSCTTGLMLTLGALAPRGEVILPSFTFMASGHAVLWNGLTPVFADCDPDTYTLDPEAVTDRLTDRTALVLGVHTFGVSCAADELAKVSGTVPLVIDAAHGFGGRYPDAGMIGGKAVAEVFSLSPTKTLAVGEGGLVTTTSADLADHLRTAREYGNPGDYDARFVGLNGRLTEINAAIGIAALRLLPHNLERRAALAACYRRTLATVPGLRFQHIPDGARSTFKDFTIAVDPEHFGLTSRELATALRAEGIDTRRYFDPPLHRQTAYRAYAPGPGALPNTDRLARTLLTLPLYAHLPEADVREICAVIMAIHDARRSVAGALRNSDGDT